MINSNSQILQLLAEGLTTQQIADKVFMSYSNVKKRISQMMEDAGVTNRTSLVSWYYEKKLQELKKAS